MTSVDQVSFRGALGRFASGVTIVSTVDDGVDHAMTVSAFSSVSLEPPLVLICIDKTARFLDAVRHSGFWSVSLLEEAGRKASATLARKGRPLAHQLDDIAHHRGTTGAALIDDSIGWIECVTHEEVPGGDHTILIGRVVGAAFREDADAPLLYYRSHYGTIIRSQESERSVYAPEASGADR